MKDCIATLILTKILKNTLFTTKDFSHPRHVSIKPILGLYMEEED